jgi:peptidoglycan/xylan/chitin deacetylase (PgdA/CDA1 family)
MTSRTALLIFVWLLALTACKPKPENRAVLPHHMSKAVVLCFHDIGRRGRYALPLEEFREILNMFRDFRVVSLADWIDGRNAEDIRPRVVLTFDDGYAAHRKLVLPELASRNYGATFYFYAEQLKQDRVWQHIARTNPRIDFGSHSWTHRLMQDTPDDVNFKELYLSRAFMETSLNRLVTSFAWPYGYYTKLAVQTARNAGFKYQVSVDYRLATRDDILKVIPRYTIYGRNAREKVRQIIGDFRQKMQPE